jgi:hypothetical protein
MDKKTFLEELILVIYILLLLFFPAITRLNEIALGMCLSIFGGVLYYGLIVMEGRDIFKGKCPFFSTHLLIMILWVVSTVFMIGFKDLEYSTIKVLIWICIIYILSLVSTLIIEWIIIGRQQQRYLKKIKIGDKFYQSSWDTTPIHVNGRIHLFINKIWVVYSITDSHVKVYDKDFPETKKTIHVSELYEMENYDCLTDYRTKENIISECETLLKHVQEMYSNKVTNDHNK